jgi:hypothetical protein
MEQGANPSAAPSGVNPEEWDHATSIPIDTPNCSGCRGHHDRIRGRMGNRTTFDRAPEKRGLKEMIAMKVLSLSQAAFGRWLVLCNEMRTGPSKLVQGSRTASNGRADEGVSSLLSRWSEHVETHRSAMLAAKKFWHLANRGASS